MERQAHEVLSNKQRMKEEKMNAKGKSQGRRNERRKQSKQETEGKVEGAQKQNKANRKKQNLQFSINNIQWNVQRYS
jgi:leucyl aminopeptidase (aminopeptidase T)